MTELNIYQFKILVNTVSVHVLRIHAVFYKWKVFLCLQLLWLLQNSSDVQQRNGF